MEKKYYKRDYRLAKVQGVKMQKPLRLDQGQIEVIDDVMAEILKCKTRAGMTLES